jgi:PAS domain S-box-containing protein
MKRVVQEPSDQVIPKNIQNLLCLIGKDGCFKKLSQDFCASLGFPQEEILNASYLKHVYIDDHLFTNQKISQLNELNPIIHSDNRMIAKDGRIRHFQWTYLYLSDQDVFGALPEDTTDKHNGHETFVEAIIENIPDMIFVKDAKNLNFIRLNKAGEDLLGYSRHDLIGKNDFDFFPEDQAKFFTAKDRSVLNEKKLVDIPEEPIQTKYLGTRIVHTKKIPLPDAEGKPKYLIGISEDITDKIKYQKIQEEIYHEQIARIELEKRLRERDEFISIASHELKSPLQSLKLQAQMFRRYKNNGCHHQLTLEKMEKFFELTEKQVHRLDRLINDMLEVSRITAGKLSIECSYLNLLDLVTEVLELMNEDFKNYPAGLPKVISQSSQIIGHWDRLRLEQVMVNLLTNALRYGRGFPIEIHLDSNDSLAHIEVRDQGMGIKKENLESIFNRFERGVEKNEVSGLGLGLFISKQIVEAHQGKIWAESELGKRSTFYVELPLYAQFGLTNKS